MTGQLPEYIEREGEHSWRLSVWVQPGAKRSELAGEYQGRLKLRVAAPAVDNKANKALEKFVATTLGLKPSRVRVASGQTSRGKTLIIETDEEPAWHCMMTR